MLKKTIFVLAIFAILAPCVLANDIQLEITDPASSSKHTTDGSVTIEFKIKNLEGSPGTATNVKLSAEEEGLKFSSTEVNIAVNETKTVSLTVTGFIWVKTSVSVSVSGSNSEYDVDGDSITLYLVPPLMKLEILTPKRQVKLVDVSTGGKANIDVIVKNSGLNTLEGVAMTASAKGGMSCSISGSGNIAPRETKKYKLSCSNITNGDRVDLRVEDKHRAASDTETVTIMLTESAKFRKLLINSPSENQEFRFGEYGGQVPVKVENTGDTILAKVCASIEGVVHNTSDCFDMPPGSGHTFTLLVYPQSELTNARITVNDSEGYTRDDVGIIIIRKESIPQGSDAINVSNASKASNTSNVDVGGGTQIVSLGDGNQAPQGSSNIEIIIAILIVVVLVVAGIALKLREKPK